MPRNIALLLACLMAIFVLQSCVASGYEFTSVSKDSVTSNHYAFPPSVFLPSCELSITLKGTAGSASYPFTLNSQIKSPNATVVLNSNLLFYSNTSCLQLGKTENPVTSSFNGFYEGSTKTLSTAATTSTWAINEYTCEPDSNDLMIYNASTAKDSNGRYPYAYSYVGRTGCAFPPPTCMGTANALASAINLIQNGINEECGVSVPQSIQFYDAATTVNCDPPNGNTLERTIFVRFNSMAAGAVNISVNDLNFINTVGGSLQDLTESYSYWIYDEETNSSTQLSTAAFPYSTELPLTPNKNYWLIMYRCSRKTVIAGHSQYKNNFDDYNISINAYEPDLSCGEFSECESGVRTRYCHDINGRIPPFYDYEECFEFATQEINLGFDDFYTMDTFYCQNAFTFGVFCEPTAYKRGRLYPTGWQIPNRTVVSPVYGTGYLYDMITLTNEKNFPDSTQPNGLSLKMWYTPRKSWLPTFNDTGFDDINCNTTNEGRLPSLWYNNIDSAFFISHNFTALSPYMGLSYRIVRCEDAMLQGTSAPLCGYVNYGCNASLFGKPFGSEDYYTFDGCPFPSTQKLPARLSTQIVDITTNTSKTITLGDNTNPAIPIQSYDFAIDKSYRSPDYMEHEINNMDINHTYEIRFALAPVSDLDDLSPYCVYLDDVNIIFRQEAPVCNLKKCFIDYDNNGIPDYSYEEDIETAGGCTPIITPMASNCVPAGIAQDVTDITTGTSDKNYTCLSGDTMASYDSVKGWTFIGNNSICIAEREAREAAEQSSTGVIDALQPAADALQASGLGFFVIFLSPIFWGFIIAVGIGAYVGFKSKIPEIGVITILGILIIESMPQFGIFPPWFIIIFIVIAGFIAVDYLKKKFTGQNN